MSPHSDAKSIALAEMFNRMTCAERHELEKSLGLADERHEIWHRSSWPQGCHQSRTLGVACFPPQDPAVTRAAWNRLYGLPERAQAIQKLESPAERPS